MSQIEVGQIMGISDEAVESLLARARRTLKVALREELRELLSDDQHE
jgi:RNA polymerase sigma-70 factor (ECF subfamily)